MLRYVAHSSGSGHTAWRLLAEPSHWHQWAPHIRGGVGLGRPEVEAGRTGVVIVGLGVLVPVRITAKEAGRWWDWRVGPIDMRHEVIANGDEDGCEVAVEMRAPFPVEHALRASYGPLVALLVRNLARVAGPSA